MKVYLNYLLLIFAMLSVNTGIYAQGKEGRNPFKLPPEIEKIIEKDRAPAAEIPEVKKEIEENPEDKAKEIEAEEQARRKEQEAQEEQEKQEAIALALKAEEEEISKISLTGIVLLEGRRTAILDRKILREGDVIGGRKIIGIEKNKVIILSNGREYAIELKGENK